MLLAVVVLLAVALGMVAARVMGGVGAGAQPVTASAAPPTEAAARPADILEETLPDLSDIHAGVERIDPAADATLPTLGELEAAPHVTAISLMEWGIERPRMLRSLHDDMVVPLKVVAGRMCNIQATVSREVAGLHLHFEFDGERHLEAQTTWDAFGTDPDDGRALSRGEHHLVVTPCVKPGPRTALPIAAEECDGTKGVGRELRFRIVEGAAP